MGSAVRIHHNEHCAAGVCQLLWIQASQSRIEQAYRECVDSTEHLSLISCSTMCLAACTHATYSRVRSFLHHSVHSPRGVGYNIMSLMLHAGWLRASVAGCHGTGRPSWQMW